jgi:hypothetical protein
MRLFAYGRPCYKIVNSDGGAGKRRSLYRLFNGSRLLKKGVPDLFDPPAEQLETLCCNLGGLLLEAEFVSDGPVDQIGMLENVGVEFLYDPCFVKGVNQSDVVGPRQQFFVVASVTENQVLNQKFDIDDSAGILFDVEGMGFWGEQFVAHLFSHLPNFVSQFFTVAAV